MEKLLTNQPVFANITGTLYQLEYSKCGLKTRNISQFADYETANRVAVLLNRQIMGKEISPTDAN